MLNTLMNRDKQAAFLVDTNHVLKEYEKVLIDTATLPIGPE
jgi:cobalt-zinc-cadmium efflux system outer membrane protein